MTGIQPTASAYSICANASVSIKKKIPEARTEKTPMTRAASAAAIAAAGMVTRTLAVTRFATRANEYAPTPKNAACPSDGSPA